MTDDRLKPGPKPGQPRRPEARFEGRPLPELIDLAEGIVIEFQSEELTVSRRLARSWASVVSTGSLDEVSGQTASMYRHIARALEEQLAPTPEPERKRGRASKGRKLASVVAIGLATMRGPVAISEMPVAVNDIPSTRAQVDITRKRRARGRRPVGEIFAELRSAA